MDYLRISKILIYSIVIFISAILGISFFIIIFPEWKTYGYEYLKYDIKINNFIPIKIQAFRAGTYICLIAFIYSTFFSFWEILKLENNKMKNILILSIGIFTWLLIPYLIFISYKDKYFAKFFNYLKQNNQIQSNIIFLNKSSYSSRNLKYIIFTYLTFLITFIGLLFIILALLNLPSSRFSYNNPSSNFLFGTISFFTQQSNFIIFLFMLFFLIFNKKKIFKNNSIMIVIATYIFFVMLVYWTALFPNIVKKGLSNRYPNSYFLLVTIWFHTINPIFFVSFSIWTLYINKFQPINFWELYKKSLIYPSIYALYSFGLPFFTQFSPYGGLTNINPNSITFYNDPNFPNKNGNPLMILIIIPTIISILVLLFIFWFLSAKFSKINIKKTLIKIK